MTAKEIPTKRPFAADGDAQHCSHCARGRVVLQTSPLAIEVRHDGRLHALQIAALEAPTCQACGRRTFTEAVDRQVNAALRAHLGLLTPDQMREAIQRLGVSQREVAESLGIAEATLSRWLNEIQIQTRSLDVLLRLYFGLPAVRAALHSGPLQSLGLSDTPDPAGSTPPHLPAP